MRPRAQLLLISGIGLAANGAPALGAVGALPFPGVLRRIPGRPAEVALTFDDGPHPRGTTTILEALSALALPATFFVTSRQVRRYPTLLRR